MDAEAVNRRWTVVGLLFAASVINYLDRSSLSLALPAISSEYHLAPTAKGVLLSSFFWSYALMQIPIGVLLDRLPIRRLYAVMFGLWSVACAMTGFARTLTALVAVRIGLGVGESIYFPGGVKTVAMLFEPRERGLPSGIFNSGTRFGMVVGGFLLPWLVLWLGWRTMFFALGFGSLLWLPAWLAAAPRSRPAAGKGLRLPKLDRNLLGICLGFFSFDYFFYLLLTWLPDYLVQVRHLSLTKAGMYSAIPFFVYTVNEAAGGWIGDRLASHVGNEVRARKWVLTFAFATGIFAVIGVRAEDLNVSIAWFSAACMTGLSTGNLIAMAQNRAPVADTAAWAGAQNFAGNCGGILAPLVTGILIERTGSYTPGFVVAAAVLLFGLLPYWLLVEET